ncbi:MAG TPA: VOC family protein [Mycobacteriales bacterium]|nr:VOC family protein [Mycobacteriales bacterium]
MLAGTGRDLLRLKWPSDQTARNAPWKGEQIVLLDGINHVAWISTDVSRLGRFYAEVFDADVGPTRTHGDDGNETMTVIGIGPHTELNIFVIAGNTEAERQTPMWGRGRIDHLGLQAATPEAFATIRQRLIDHGASDGSVNNFGQVHSIFFRDPDGLEGEVLIDTTST